MEYRYFPGCTLHEQARNFDITARESARELDIALVELDNWQCCGAVFPLATDALINLVSPYRALASAHAAGFDLVTLCSGCLNVLRRTNRLVATDREAREKLRDFVEMDYAGERRVYHLLEVLRREVTFETLRSRVKRRLTGLHVAPYYGCLLLRPPEEMEFDDVEAPTVMEDFLRALGAEPVDYPFRTECCGAYVALREAKTQAAAQVVRSAAAAGAELVVSSCPACNYNLERVHPTLPVVYFTQLLALALGRDGAFAGQVPDPTPLLRGKSLLPEVS